MRTKRSLEDKYPPSEPCSCEVCSSYCRRPGWWTVSQAAAAIDAGYGARMMLEMSPERTIGVLAPAFKGCETAFADQRFAGGGCTFLQAGRCELHGTAHQPLECCFCHHSRIGLGPRCHADLESDWNTAAGRALVVKWTNATGFWQHLSEAYFSRNRRPPPGRVP